MDYTVEQISSLLKKHMEENNLSVYRVVKDSKLNKRTIERYLNNGGYDPQTSTNRKLLEYLGYKGRIEKS